MKLPDHQYKEIIDNVANFNSKLKRDRKSRVPFIDQQTGIAQGPCSLWMTALDRIPIDVPEYSYCYPAKRWKRKPSLFSTTQPYLQHFVGNRPELVDAETHHITGVENLAAEYAGSIEESIAGEEAVTVATNVEKHERHGMHSERQWIAVDEDEYDDELPDNADVANDSEGSDFEESLKSKRKRKSGATSSSKRSRPHYPKVLADGAEVEKFWICSLCQSQYKTRSGLVYHLGAAHPNDAGTYGPITPIIRRHLPSSASASGDGASGAGSSKTDASGSSRVGLSGERAAFGNRSLTSGKCDFCEGDAANSVSRQHETLISCADCGRAAHPSCLQFSENMIRSTRRYRWQCIECKSCWVCGTQENDDQLLFCDDCDRGYHLYCLKPPLAEPPEGNWSCDLCVREFHGGVAPTSTAHLAAT